jgi:methylthioribose-1-phosphate isomerase
MKTNKELTNIQLSDDGRSVIIIDQTLLPNVTKYISLQTAEELYEAIYTLRVRGAPAIGIFAAYALYILAKQIKTKDYKRFSSEVQKYSAYLNSSRPTAVNLSTQLKRMEKLVKSLNTQPVSQILDAMKDEAIEIHREDIDMCKAISEHGIKLIKNGFGIMTQCNAGPLATSKYGTALGPIIMGHERGIKLHAYICETRPLLQGARLTAYELDNVGVNCTLICDNMASIVMSEGKINAVFAGCDRIAANGDVANKIGTSGLAILAKHYNIPFYIFGPSTTIDMECKTGADIKIELRDPKEIKEMFYTKSMAPKEVNCYNPSFDVTPNNLITKIITENGIWTKSVSKSFDI